MAAFFNTGWIPHPLLDFGIGTAASINPAPVIMPSPSMANGMGDALTEFSPLLFLYGVWPFRGLSSKPYKCHRPPSPSP